MFDVKLSLTLFRRAKMQPASRMRALSMVLFSAVLFAVGCGDNGGDAVSASDDQSGETKANPQRQGHISGQKPKIPEPQSIPGMNADAVLTTLLKPGLECWQPNDKDVLYLCSSEENENLTLLYEGKVAGRSAHQVSSVKVRVARRGAEDFEQHSQPFLGLLATQLKYRGANKDQAYEFVSHNPSGGKATTTIGEATWIMSSSEDSKVLTITPA
jgi:hypothetical protein